MSRRDLSVKGGTSERCYRTRRGRTNEQRYAIISPYVDGRMQSATDLQLSQRGEGAYHGTVVYFVTFRCCFFP
jgi:hypothetical protein